MNLDPNGYPCKCGLIFRTPTDKGLHVRKESPQCRYNPEERAAAYKVLHRRARRRFAQSDRGKAAQRSAAASERQRHPERVRARSKVRTAVKFGRLTRQPCYCGSTEVQAHHYLGYEPEHELDVVWLCARHHQEVHRAA